MMNNIKQFIKDNIILIFIFFIVIMIVSSKIYSNGLSPSNKNINEIMNKYKTNEYSIPIYVAERYLIWYNMRTFFFAFNYIFTLLSIFASLLTIFYASNTSNNTVDKKNKYIVFLSLLSMCFTIADIFINPGAMANMAQHAWRELDTCIMQTVDNNNLSNTDKNKIIIDKVVEMEKYIETYEH